MPKLTSDQINDLLSSLPEWERDTDSGAIFRNLEFDSFADAIAFVNRIAPFADEHDHHPDIDIRYRRVKIALISHDVGGLTDRDAAMVKIIEANV